MIRLPAPPYCVVVFTSKRSADGAGYAEAADRMASLAKAAPGHLGHVSVRGADGVGVTLSYWSSREDAEAFRRLPDHRAAQARGRTAWYDWYVSEVTVVASRREGGASAEQFFD